MATLKFTLLLALLLAAQSATAHTYFKAEMVPFGDQAPDAPDSSAYLDFMVHADEGFYKLNVTDVADMAGVKLVYGDPEVSSEEVVTVYSADVPFEGTDFFEGVFNVTEFAPEYPWSMKGLMANIGLGHIWAVVVNPEDYKNIMLAGKVEKYTPAGGH